MPKIIPGGKVNSKQFVAAIDPSLGSAGVVVADTGWDIGKLVVQVFRAGEPEKALAERISRWINHATNIMQCIGKVCHKPSLIVIEGYSFGSKGRATVSLGEFGGVLRYELTHEFFCKIVEVPPKSLKMFVCGNGNAKKTEMVATLARQYGVMYKTDDEYDALGLWLLGRCILNPKLCKNATQRKVVNGFIQ